MVSCNPVVRSVFASKSNSVFALAVSRRLLGCPSGLEASQIICPSNPASLATKFTNSLIVTSFPVPRFTGAGLSYFSVAARIPSAASSTYRNSLDALPVPQTVTCFSPFCTAEWFRVAL
jgi:hypothetical protein